MKHLNKNINFIIFFYISHQYFFTAAIKNILKYSNYIDEFIIILILFYFLFNLNNLQKLILFYKKNIFLFFIIIYVFFCFIYWKIYDYENILRVKYYLIHIFFLSTIFSVSNFRKFHYEYEKILFFLLFFSIFFGFLNFIFQENFLNFFYENLNRLDVTYHNTNARLISLFGNPINFGFICNFYLVYLIYQSNLKRKINFVLIFITTLILFFTYSRLAYIVFGFTVFIFLINNKKFKIILFIIFFIIMYTFFAKEIIHFLWSYEINNFVILFLRRIHEMVTFQYFSNYLNQLLVLDYLKNDLNLVFFIGNGFNSLGWSENRFLLEFSFATIIYEVGFIGLSLYVIIILSYFKFIISSFNVFDLNIFIILFLYSLLNNGLLYNPYALLFFYHYLRVKYRND